MLDEKYANSYDGEDEERPNDDEGLVMSLKKIISDEEESDSSSVSSTQSEHALLADKKNIHELLNITQNETTDVFQS